MHVSRWRLTMQRVLMFPVLLICLAIGSSACSTNRVGGNEATYKDNAARALPDRDQVEVTGCLTANTDLNQFVLTANSTALTSLTNRAGGGQAETFHYQLVGGTNLEQYVGKEVAVKGSVEGKTKDVDIESKEGTTKDKSRGEEATPAIQSKSEIDMQVQRLNVASITPTGSACQIGNR